jgi:protein-S-isoprenylcysteine O-methyltransferase Ste14
MWEDLLLVVAWGTVAVVWALAPRGGGSHTGGRSWLAAIVAVWLLYGPGLPWASLTVSATWLHATGVALLVAATAFTVWARLVLGPMWSADVTAGPDHELRARGPYAVTRHPIYAGGLGMLAATALLDDLGRWIGVLAAATVFLVVKARAEERNLRRVFPAEYGRR